MRWPILSILIGLVAGTLGFARFASRSNPHPLRDVVVPVTGKQYRVSDRLRFTAFVAYGPDREAWRREAMGLAPYLAERAALTGDSVATAVALRTGFAGLLPTHAVVWYRFVRRADGWQLQAEASTRQGLTPRQ